MCLVVCNYEVPLVLCPAIQATGRRIVHIWVWLHLMLTFACSGEPRLLMLHFVMDAGIKWGAARFTPLGMAVPTGQRARRRRPQSVQSSLHSSCSSSLCSYLSGLRRLLLSTWYSAFSRYWQYGRIVATRYGSIDATTATQLLINTTWFSLFRDIGTPRHWNLESKHRDIGTSGHWNPECTGRGKGTDPRTGKGHRPEERFSFFRYPLAVTGGLSAARFTAKLLMEVTTSWVGACCSPVQFLVFFPETLRGGAVRGGVRRPLFKSCHRLETVASRTLWLGG